jgi:hypothetical protein
MHHVISAIDNNEKMVFTRINEEKYMEIAMLIITGIGAMAGVISALFAFKAKTTAEEVLNNISNTKISNSGDNSGVINAANTGKIKNETSRN